MHFDLPTKTHKLEHFRYELHATTRREEYFLVRSMKDCFQSGQDITIHVSSVKIHFCTCLHDKDNIGVLVQKYLSYSHDGNIEMFLNRINSISHFLKVKEANLSFRPDHKCKH